MNNPENLVSRLFNEIQSCELKVDPEEIDVGSFERAYQDVEDLFGNLTAGGEVSSTAAAELDQALFLCVSAEEMTKSTIRFATCHILSTCHHYYAGLSAGFDQAYQWCLNARTQDGLTDYDFLRGKVCRKLVTEGPGRGNPKLALFLLERIGHFMTTQGVPMLEDSQAEELLDLEALDVILRLAQRNAELAPPLPAERSGSLEHSLQTARKTVLDRIRSRNEGDNFLEHMLAQYQITRPQSSFWEKLSSAIGRFNRGIGTTSHSIGHRFRTSGLAYIWQAFQALFVLLVAALFLVLFVIKHQELGDDLDVELRQSKTRLDTKIQEIQSSSKVKWEEIQDKRRAEK